MIFYRVDIELLSEFVNNEKSESEKLNHWQKAEYLSPYNVGFLDAYEENNISLILQFAAIDTALNILAYAAYEPKHVVKGIIDVEQDVLDACKFIKIPSEVRHIVYQEISASDFNRALQRYDINNSRLREFTSKRFGLDCFRYDTYGYELSERVIENDLITNKKNSKGCNEKIASGCRYGR